MPQKSYIPISVDIAVLIARIGVSILMFRHGWAKMDNLLGGNWTFPDPIGLGSSASLLLTIFAELGCSFAFMVGALTRPAAIILAFTMFVAAFFVHKGEPMAEREASLLFMTLYILIAILGPGKFSIDQRWVNKYFA